MKYPLLLTTALLMTFVGCTTGIDNCCRAVAAKNIQPRTLASIPTAVSLGHRPGLIGPIVKYLPAKPSAQPFYRGGCFRTTEGLREIKALGVRSMLSPLPSKELFALAAKEEIKVQSLFFNKSSLDLPTAQAAIAYMRAAPKPLYLFCLDGTRRAGILAMLYRIHIEGRSYGAAEKEFLLLGGSTTKDAAMLKAVRATLPAN